MQWVKLIIRISIIFTTISFLPLYSLCFYIILTFIHFFNFPPIYSSSKYLTEIGGVFYFSKKFCQLSYITAIIQLQYSLVKYANYGKKKFLTKILPDIKIFSIAIILLISPFFLSIVYHPFYLHLSLAQYHYQKVK